MISCFIKLILLIIDLKISSNWSYSKYTRLIFYDHWVFLWPLLYDLCTIIIIMALKHPKTAKEKIFQLFYKLIIQDLILCSYFVLCYYFIFQEYSTFIKDGKISGHWLAYSIHNIMIVKNLANDIVSEKRESNIIMKVMTIIGYSMIFLSFWTLIWTTLIFHTIFESIMGYIFGSIGGLIFLISRPQISTSYIELQKLSA